MDSAFCDQYAIGTSIRNGMSQLLLIIRIEPDILIRQISIDIILFYYYKSRKYTYYLYTGSFLYPSGAGCFFTGRCI